MPDASEIKFTKMHGIGNDYVYIDCLESTPRDLEALAMEMSDRHTGVGGDGIILICPSDKADVKMRILNADGSEAMMCGNGVRCVGKYVWDNGLVKETTVRVDTLSGVKIINLEIDPDTGKATGATVNMGAPALPPLNGLHLNAIGESTSLSTAGETVEAIPVSMGNPHAVIFTDDVENIPLDTAGPLLERHPAWPDRANIEFAQVKDRGHIRMRVWERGSGITRACGTGACATAVAAIATGRCDNKVVIELDGGELTIEWNGSPSGAVYMTGPAEKVFTGCYHRRS